MKRIYQVKQGRTKVTSIDLRRWERDGTIYSRLMSEADLVTSVDTIRVNFPSWFDVFSAEDQLRIIKGVSAVIQTGL